MRRHQISEQAHIVGVVANGKEIPCPVFQTAHYQHSVNGRFLGTPIGAANCDDRGTRPTSVASDLSNLRTCWMSLFVLNTSFALKFPNDLSAHFLHVGRTIFLDEHCRDISPGRIHAPPRP